MTLPYDIARCMGCGFELCVTCRRKEPGREFYQSYIAPQVNSSGCVNYIKPEHQIITTDKTA